MKAYDTDTAPRASDWLSSDEEERLALVESYHRRKRIHLPRARAHAVFHVIVENQLTLAEQVVVETLAPDVGGHREYFEALKSLTADAWRTSG